MEYQTDPEMIWSKNEIEHVKPISSLDVSKNKVKRETFNWTKHSTNNKKENLQKGTEPNSIKYTINCSLLYLINYSN